MSYPTRLISKLCDTCVCAMVNAVSAITSLIFSRTLTSDLTSGTGTATPTFTRASSANYFPAGGGNLASVATNVAAFTDGGVQIEESRTNDLKYNRDYTQSWWVKTNVSVSKDQTGIDGVANSCCLLDDSSGSQYGLVHKTITITDDSNSHCFSAYIKKDADTSRFPEVQLKTTGGTVVELKVGINTSTGAIVERTATGTVSSSIHAVTVDGVDWWRVVLVIANNTTGNTSIVAQIYPAVGTVIGVVDVAATGTIVVDHMQLELNQKFPSSPIETGAASVTRAASYLNYPAIVPVNDFVVKAVFKMPDEWVFDGSETLFQIIQGGTYWRVYMHATDAGRLIFERSTLGNLVLYRSAPVAGEEFTVRLRVDSINNSAGWDDTNKSPEHIGVTNFASPANLELGSRGGVLHFSGQIKSLEIHEGNFTDAEVLAL